MDPDPYGQSKPMHRQSPEEQAGTSSANVAAALTPPWALEPESTSGIYCALGNRAGVGRPLTSSNPSMLAFGFCSFEVLVLKCL